eukprot:SAG11_NODE_1427_length_4940_cov_8.678026_2_plen_1426_part_00
MSNVQSVKLQNQVNDKYFFFTFFFYIKNISQHKLDIGHWTLDRNRKSSNSAWRVEPKVIKMAGLTRVFADYTRQKTCFTSEVDEEGLVEYLSKKGQRKTVVHASIRKPTFSQQILGTDICKLFLDVDGPAQATAGDAERLTGLLLQEVPKMISKKLDVPQKTLAISQSTGEDASKPGSFKVSLHICATTQKCVWSQQPEYYRQKGINTVTIDDVECCLIDSSIYGTKNQLRMINNGKPTDPVRIKRPVTLVNNLLAHVPSCLMDVCGGLKVKTVAPDPVLVKSKSAKKSVAGGGGADRPHLQNLDTKIGTAQDFKTLLFACESNCSRNQWLPLLSLCKSAALVFDLMSEEQAVALSDEWSSSADNYQPGEIQDIWSGLKLLESDGVGCSLDLIFKYADWRKVREWRNKRFIDHILHGSGVCDQREIARMFCFNVGDMIYDNYPAKESSFGMYSTNDGGIFEEVARNHIFMDPFDELQEQLRSVYAQLFEIQQGLKDDCHEDDEWKLRRLDYYLPGLKIVVHHQTKGLGNVAIRNSVIHFIQGQLGFPKKKGQKDALGNIARLEYMWNSPKVMEYIFPFANGVFDAKNYMIRSAQVSSGEYIRSENTAGYDYVQSTLAERKKALDAVCTMFATNEQLGFILVERSLMVLGFNPFQNWSPAIGEGGNGKGALANAMSNVCGNLFGTIPAQYFQKPASAANEQTSFMYTNRYKRWVVSTELESDLKVIRASIKKVTSDLISCRGLFKDQFSYYAGYTTEVDMNDELMLDQASGGDEPIERRSGGARFPFLFNGGSAPNSKSADGELYEYMHHSDEFRRGFLDILLIVYENITKHIIPEVQRISDIGDSAVCQQYGIKQPDDWKSEFKQMIQAGDLVRYYLFGTGNGCLKKMKITAEGWKQGKDAWSVLKDGQVPLLDGLDARINPYNHEYQLTELHEEFHETLKDNKDKKFWTLARVKAQVLKIGLGVKIKKDEYGNKKNFVFGMMDAPRADMQEATVKTYDAKFFKPNFDDVEHPFYCGMDKENVYNLIMSADLPEIFVESIASNDEVSFGKQMQGFMSEVEAMPYDTSLPDFFLCTSSEEEEALQTQVSEWDYVESDNYMTSKRAWEAIQDYIPTGKVIWEPFFGDGESGKHLKDLGFEVIHKKIDFFSNNEGDIIVSNPPFSLKKEVFERLKVLDKPFIILAPASYMQAVWFQTLFKNQIQIMIPNTRPKFYHITSPEKPYSAVPTCYFCYKMNLQSDMFTLESIEEEEDDEGNILFIIVLFDYWLRFLCDVEEEGAGVGDVQAKQELDAKQGSEEEGAGVGDVQVKQELDAKQEEESAKPVDEPEMEYPDGKPNDDWTLDQMIAYKKDKLMEKEEQQKKNAVDFEYDEMIYKRLPDNMVLDHKMRMMGHLQDDGSIEFNEGMEEIHDTNKAVSKYVYMFSVVST